MNGALTLIEAGRGRIEGSWRAYGEDEFSVQLTPSLCMECGKSFQTMPTGFVYDDPASGWNQNITDPRNFPISGYCAPCADALATANHQEYVNGNWERRTLEDEFYIWDR